MNASRFWEIVEASRTAFDPSVRDGNMDRQAQHLEVLLSALSPSDRSAFARHFLAAYHRAYSWNLWRAAYLIAGGCSDDGFMDFRSWLISMGRVVFEQALADPDSLCDVLVDPSIEDVFFEAFGPGKSLGPDGPAHPATPSGVRFEDSAEEFQRRLPRLWGRYGAALR